MEPRQAKRRIQELPVIGGGAIEGLVVWGGALVTIRKGRKVDDMKEMEDIPVNENPSKKFHETAKIDSSELKNLTSEENAVQTITDNNGEDNDSESDHQETLLLDTEGESITVSDDDCVAEEFPLPTTDSSSWNESESMSDNDDEEKSFSMESSLSSASATDDEEEDSSIQSSMSSILSTDDEEEDSSMSSILSTDKEEEDSSIQSSMSSMLSTDEEEKDSPIQSLMSLVLSIEEEDQSSAIQSTLSTGKGKGEDDDDGGRAITIARGEDSSEGTWISSIESKIEAGKGKEGEDDDEDGRGIGIGEGEESSEGTWISSIEYKVKAVWPVEMVEALSTESKDKNLSSQIPVEKKNNEVSKTGEYCYLENANNGGSENMRLVKNKKKFEGPALIRRKVRVNSIFVLMLLFLLANALLSFSL